MGSIVDSVSSLFGDSSADRNQSRDMNSVGDIANQQQTAYDQYYHPALQSYLQQSGLNTTTGQFDPNYDPYGDGTGNGLVSQYEEGTSGQYDNAVNSANHDLMGRGFTGENSLSGSVIGNIRNQQAQNIASSSVQVGIDANNARYQRMGDALNSVMGAGQGASSTYSNLGQQYGNQAQQQVQNITSGINAAASAGAF
jgi:hypothetical protein